MGVLKPPLNKILIRSFTVSFFFFVWRKSVIS